MSAAAAAPRGDNFPLHPSASDVDVVMAALHGKQAEWASLPLTEKADILKDIRLRMLSIIEEMAKASVAVKGLQNQPPAAPHEAVRLSVIVGGFLKRLEAVVRYAAQHGQCPTHPMKQLPSGQQVAKVFPSGLGDMLLEVYGLYGYRVEVWIQPGKRPSQGTGLLKNGDGGLAVVLAAGNHSYIGLMDALEQLYMHNRVAVLKYHDVQAPMTCYLEYLTAPLRERGYLWDAQAKLEVAKQLIYHPMTTHVHITGGNATHDAIVWGPPGEQREERLKANKPVLKVPITSELGNISPWLVTPSPSWTEAELEHHAQAVANALTDNSSCNCLAAKVILLSDAWEHAGAFVDRIKAAIRAVPPVPPYYPGIQQRFDAFVQHNPGAEIIHSSRQNGMRDGMPVAVLEFDGLPKGTEHCMTVEPFSPVLTIIRIPSSGPVEFLERAVSFCNNSVWGSLTCSLIVHPTTAKEHKRAVDDAIEALQYGTVVVNGWGGLGFACEVMHWGGFGGTQTLADPVSGLGSGHNAYMYDHAQKSVLWTPFISGLHPMPIHICPLPMALPFKPSVSWAWSIARIFAGWSINGLPGIWRILFPASSSCGSTSTD